MKTKVRVTFELPAELAQNAENVFLAGDFNEWDETATPMDRKVDKKSGKRFTLTLDLTLGKEYQYRYLLDGTNWQNDWDAEKYVPNPFSGDNSVVLTYPPADGVLD